MNNHPCNDLITEIYKDLKVNELLNKLNPPELRDDLRQEFALVLLDYDCDRLQLMKAEGTLVSFSRRVLWKMATLPNGHFIRKYRKASPLPLPAEDNITATTPEELDAEEAIKTITLEIGRKMELDANEAHEAIIFKKYSEMLSCEKVAQFFGVPRIHIFRVVKKVKAELKTKIIK